MVHIIDMLKAYFTRTPSAAKYFPVTKSNGEIQGQISQDDLVAAVKEALPSILADQSTNFASVLTKNAQGVLGVATNANLASVLGVQYITISPSSTVKYLDELTGEQNTLFRFGEQTINDRGKCYGIGRCIILADYAYQEVVAGGTPSRKYYRFKYTPRGQEFSWPSTWYEIAYVS